MNYQNYLRKKTEKDPSLKKRLEFENWLSEMAINIAKIRKEKGYSQEDLADKMSIKQSMVARIESGHNITCETIWKLSDSLDTNIVIFGASIEEEAAKLDELTKSTNVSYQTNWRNAFENVEIQLESTKIPIFNNIYNLNYNEQKKFCTTAA